MADLKFKKVSSVPSTGDIGDIYFVDNGTERSIYICTAANTFTKYAETERELLSNKSTSLSSSSTDTQYPSAKAVYDVIVENEEVTAAAINNLTDRLDNILSISITSNGTTLTLQQWIDRISAVTVDV